MAGQMVAMRGKKLEQLVSVYWSVPRKSTPFLRRTHKGISKNQDKWKNAVFRFIVVSAKPMAIFLSDRLNQHTAV